MLYTTNLFQLIESAWSYLNAFDVTSVNLKQNYKESQPTYTHVSLLNFTKLQAQTAALTGIYAAVP